MPGVEFSPDTRKHPDGLEAQAAVQRDARLVGQRDAGVSVRETSIPQFHQQGRVKRTGDALPMIIRVNIGRGFDRPTVGLSRAMR